MLNRLKCNACHKLIKYKDFVYLDLLNSVIHQRCYTPIFDVKDKGIFQEVMKKYPLFEEW